MPAKTEFWTSPELWPVEPRGFLFIARAVDELGRSMFPNHWTGEEPYTEIPLTADQAERNFLLPLERQRTVVSAMKASSYGTRSDRLEAATSLLTKLEARPEFNRDCAQRIFNAAMPAIERLCMVASELHSLLIRGERKAVVQNIAGGQLLSVAADAWPSIDILKVISTCRLSKLTGDKWLFTEGPSHAASTENTAIVTSGVGKTKRSIQEAYKAIFPSGSIPIGMSSQDRNDQILSKLKKHGLKTRPDKRTIERAINDLTK